MKNKKLVAIDLFCGIGGFSHGLKKAGFKILFGIDNWEVSLKTFRKNHLDSETILSDIKKIKDSFYNNYQNKVDVIIAGPPCQGFSMSGKREIGDKRNTLFEEVIRAVSLVKPKIVLIENVVGLLSMRNPEGEFIKDLIPRKLSEIGYKTEFKVLNASDYGVPQSRRRVLFIGSRIGEIDFPEPLHEKVSVEDALGNIPNYPAEKYTLPKTKFQKLMADGNIQIFNHQPMNHNSLILKRISLVPRGGNWQDVPKEYYQVGGNHSNNYRRLDPTKPSITLKHATKSMIIHPKFDRVITAREVARLQSFSDSFILEGSASEQHQQLANAVPPLLAFAVGKHIRKKIEGKKNGK